MLDGRRVNDWLSARQQVPAASEPTAVTDYAFGRESLERLSRLDTRGHPVLSVYLDLDPTLDANPEVAARVLERMGSHTHHVH